MPEVLPEFGNNVRPTLFQEMMLQDVSQTCETTMLVIMYFTPKKENPFNHIPICGIKKTRAIIEGIIA